MASNVLHAAYDGAGADGSAPNTLRKDPTARLGGGTTTTTVKGKLVKSRNVSGGDEPPSPLTNRNRLRKGSGPGPVLESGMSNVPVGSRSP
jgi:hypothetical protein